MFKRNDFDAYMIQAQSYLDQSDADPIQLRNALVMMMNGMKTLADSCENDLKDQLQQMADESKSSIVR